MTDVIAVEKKCPECGETLPADASLCRHCGFVLVAAKGEVAPAPTPVKSPSVDSNQTSVWDAAQMLFPRRVVGAVVGVLVIIVLLVIWFGRMSEPPRKETPDTGFVEVLVSQLPGTAQASAMDGHCRIVLAADTTGQQIDVLAIAQDVARRYSRWRSRYGKNEHVRVEVFVGDTKVAEAQQ